MPQNKRTEFKQGSRKDAAVVRDPAQFRGAQFHPGHGLGLELRVRVAAAALASRNPNELLLEDQPDTRFL